MKKLIAILVCLLMVSTLISCSNAAEQALIGTWKLVDTETETDYGLGIEFTKDGKIRYGLTEEVFEALADGEDAEDAMAGLDMLMSIEYKVKSETEMEITAKALFGLAKESEIAKYSLKGDTLIFDGATYTRVK